MKKFVFISDFDGTLTHRDFYHIVIEKYLKESGIKLYDEWKNHKINDIDFLNNVFKSIDRSEGKILEDILSIPFDKYAKSFIEKIKKSGGDFIILSAGTSYYIEKLLEHENIKDVLIISNNGVYKDRGIHLIPDEKSPYYSKIYGIDKLIVVEKLKKEYKKVYYAGDSQPDFKACLLADTIFAKAGLQAMLREIERPFIGFSDFKQIENYFIENGVIINDNSIA